MESDPVAIFANFFLVRKEADWVKPKRKLGTINIQKIKIIFRFIDDPLKNTIRIFTQQI